jgi:hypothetical protein
MVAVAGEILTVGNELIVNVEEHVAVFPQLSVAVHVTVCDPALNIAPLSVVPELGLTPTSVEYVNDVIVGQPGSAVAVAFQEFDNLVKALAAQTFESAGHDNTGPPLIITTIVETIVEGQVPTVVVSVYVPPAAIVTFGRIGF